MKITLAVLLLSSSLVAQEAKKPSDVSLAELIDAYRTIVTVSQRSVQDADARVAKTPEYQDFKAKLEAHQKLQDRLAATLKEKTGKVMDWQTGALKDAPTASK